MYRLALYFVRQMIPWLALCLAGLMLAFLTTQLMRVSPVFIGAGAKAGESLRAIGLLSLPIAGWALTPAFSVSVFTVMGRMAADGELVALQASGLDRFRLAFGPLALALALCMLSAWVWLELGPRCQRELRITAIDLAARAALGKMEQGVFFEPIEGVTFFADRKTAKGTFERILIEDARNRFRTEQFIAEKGSIFVNASKRTLEIRMNSGAAFFSPTNPGAAPFLVSFKSLELKLPLQAELERRLDFLPELLAETTGSLLGPAPKNISGEQWRYALWRRVAGPVGFLSFSLLSISLALGLSFKRPKTAVAGAAGLFLAYHLLCRATESLIQTGAMPAFLAALLPAAIVFAAFAAVAAASLSHASRRQ